jgi:hypothetical protein
MSGVMQKLRSVKRAAKQVEKREIKAARKREREQAKEVKRDSTGLVS